MNGSTKPPRSTKKKMGCTERIGKGMKCRSGLKTNSSVWNGFGRRKRNWKWKLKPQQKAHGIRAEPVPTPNHDAKPTGKPNKKAQRNFTDPESQIMKSADGFMQAYNCQAAVDADNQIIVAQHIATNGSDTHELGSVLKEIRRHGHGQAKEISADSAYCSEYNLKQLRRRHIRGYVASRWQKDSRHNQSDRKPPTTVGKYVR